MAPWQASLDDLPPPQAAALPPAALQELVESHMVRHKRRLGAVEAAEQAQLALSAELRETLEHAARVQAAPEPDFFSRVRGLFIEEEPPDSPLVDTLWQHHDRAQGCLRDLGHHAWALERELCTLEQALAELGGQLLALEGDLERAAAAVSALELAEIRLSAQLKRAEGAQRRRLRAELDALQARLGALRRDKRRYAAAQPALLGIQGLQRELAELLRDQLESLERSHSRGTAALEPLVRHVSALRGLAGRRDLDRAAVAAMAELETLLGHTAGLMDSELAPLARELDDLGARMARFDAETQARRLAEAEVEAALRDV